MKLESGLRIHGSYNDCFKEEDTSYKMQRPSQISLIAHTAKIVAKILRRRIEKKNEDVLREDQFGFRSGKGKGMQLGC